MRPDSSRAVAGARQPPTEIYVSYWKSENAQEERGFAIQDAVWVIRHGIVYADEDGRIIECNRAFSEMLGYSPGELEGKTYRDITPTDWHPVDEDIVESQIKNAGYSGEYMKEYLTKIGARVPVSMRAWVMRDRGGKPAGSWAVIRNMRERIQYENFMRETLMRLDQANDRLQELDRLKTELVATVSHERRAPLAAIESSIYAMRALRL